MIAGLATPAFADTAVATFFDPNSPNGTPNPLANGDPKTNDWGDVVNPQTNLGGPPGNFDATEPGLIPPPDQNVDLYCQAFSIGEFGSACTVIGTNGQILTPFDVVRGFEEGSFTFTGFTPGATATVTVIISDIDDEGATLDSAGTMPAVETVFVTGNGVDLGIVTPNGIGNDQVITKTFVILAQADGSGELNIGFNQVFRFNGLSGGQSGIRVEQISIETDMQAVGGEFLPLDSTALLLAAAQSPAAWLSSLALVTLGIGAYVFTRNSSNMRNIKVILRDYLDRF